MTQPYLTPAQLAKAKQTLSGQKIAVLMGGHSAEREISLLTGQGVLNALLSHQLDAHAFDPATTPLQDLKTQSFDVCFIALHGRFGEDGTIQGALELMGIPYTGSGVMASSIAMDKTMTKRIWQAQGLPTPGWRLVHSAQETEQAFAELGSPMIVKPAREGSTIGLTKVTHGQDCQTAYAKASQLDAQVLCEQFIQGDEVTCPVIDMPQTGSGSLAPQALPVIRIVAPEGNYDYENKYFKDETQYLVPCGLPDGEEQVIQEIVLQAYQAIGCKTWARADVMIDQHTRKPYLLEINTSPGMTSHSLVPMSAKAAGISYEDLCLHLLSLATLEHDLQTHQTAK